MIYLYTDHFQEEIQNALSRIEGLHDAIRIEPLSATDLHTDHVVIQENQIMLPLPWDITEPPILIEPIPFNTDDLVAALLGKLGYEPEALEFCKSPALQEFILYRQQLKDMTQSIGNFSARENQYVSVHNYAVLTHYASHLHNGIPTEKLYKEAIALAPSDEHAAFSAKHFATLLMDNGQSSEAKDLLRHHKAKAFSEVAKFHLTLDLINVLMASQLLPYDPKSGDEIKPLIGESIPYFEQHGTHWATAGLYTHASEIANFEKSYSESLGYINKAIAIYEEQEFPEFLASAYLRKGTLLYTWAQDDNPQFFQSAIDTYQRALQTFTQEYFPDVYAEIHHNLAVIYAEMPVDEKKRSMWSAFSATSFKECLNFYNKEVYPFEYAMVANNYANALLKYPAAKTGDNTEKAIYFYLEALEIRNSRQFPLERAHTILNYLEACWRAHNLNKTMEHARFKDMLAKAKEVPTLTDNDELISQAQAHLDQISALSLTLMKN